MPKMKTHSGTKKRVKVTGSGKLMHRQANLGHLNEHKSATRMRRLKGNVVLAAPEAKKAKRLLGKNKGR
ncbi:MAG: 50S ribosomal protein L35 [Propionibacterium sp.]|nr:MAG: 50S ribosomal protein L35 [Propionibacterium sp.]